MGFAQVNDGGGHSMMQINISPSDNVNGIKGTPYLYEDFRTGTVIMEGKAPLSAFLRYNINSETFEIKTEKDGEEIYVLPLSTETEYHLGTEIFTYRNLNFEGKDISGYFQTHFDGNKVSLLEKPSLFFVEAINAKTPYEKDIPGQIKLNKDLYLVFSDGSAKAVSLKEKDFERAFSSSKSVKKYLGDNKLKTIQDFTKMLEWYDNQVE